MSNKKQSSVQWLFEQVVNLDWRNMVGEEKIKIFQQAKEMHKQEIVRAVEHGYLEINNSGQYGVGETYYSQTFEP